MHQYLPFVLIIVAYLLVVTVASWLANRRRRAERRKQEKLIESLQQGDDVVTAGGIYGTIEAVRDKTVTLRIAPDVQITLDRRAVRRHKDES